MKVLLVIATVLTVISTDELSDCKCQDGFNPTKDETGVNCHGVTLKSVKSILPCNLILKPDCVCNNETTSIVQDASGVWCGKVVEGKEENRWECENQEDWITFYEKYPEEKPQETSTEEKKTI